MTISNSGRMATSHSLYAGQDKEELLELSDDYEDRTEVAQEILRDELRKRTPQSNFDEMAIW